MSSLSFPMMDSFQRRRVVSTTTNFLVAREAATPTAATETANPTIAPFYTNLNGVDQPVNLLLADILWWSIGIVGFLVLGIRIIELLWGKLRQVSAMSVPGDKQAYWKSSQWSWMPGMKKYLIYAPLWKKRHNREIRLSSAINMGTLPSRLHFILLFLYVGSNFAYMFILNWDNKNKWSFMAEVRGRSGTISAFNMVPLIIFAGRNNPLIGMLSISFDTYNLFHRWIGRVAVAEAVIHTISWAVVVHADGGWDLIWEKVQFDTFIASGTAATIAMVILLILSLSSLRHAFYETFLNIHIILAFVTIIGTYMHCITATIPGVGGLPEVTMVIAILALWFADRLARMMRIVYYNWSSRGMTEAIVEPMPGEAVRVTMHLPRYVDVKPGSHAYLRFAQANWWECHPFSIAWTEHKTAAKGRLPVTEKDATKERKVSTSVSFIIGAHTGMTRKLYNVALKSGERAIAMRAAFEGPYAGHHSLDSYGHAVLFAGSTGITHQISFLKPLIEGYNSGRVATRKITLVWIVRDYESLEWVKPWMNEVLRMPNRRDILRIKLFVTRPKNPRVISSPSETVEMLAGRPNVSTILNKECANQIGAMCVTVCGPGALADDVRQAVRGVQDGDNVVDFIEESFTW